MQMKHFKNKIWKVKEAVVSLLFELPLVEEILMLS